MANRQLRAPNLDTTDIPGWCLRLVLHAFGFNGGAEYARAEWDRNPFKHTDPLPTDVAVPVFYSWVGTIDGITRDWGDVAIFVPGRGVFGTPMRGGSHNRWDTSVEARRIAIGGNARYLGWTEGLNGTRVIESISNNQQGSEPVISNVDNEWGRWRDLFIRIRGREPSRQEFVNAAVGQNWLRAIEILVDGSSEAAEAQHAQDVGQLAIRDNWAGQIATLQQQAAELSARPTKENFEKLQTALNQCTITNDVSQKQLSELKAKQQADQQAGENFIRRVGQLIKKYIPGL